MSDEFIRASEIGEYIYCQRAWWLRRVQGYQSSNVRELKAGSEHHEGHGRTVQRAQRSRKFGVVLLFIAIFALTFWWLTL